MAIKYPIGTSGFVSSGENISLHWVEPHEYDYVTQLRNNDQVRRWFIDDRRIDIESNRLWLSNGMKKPKESLLSIRLKETGQFLGTIGWTNWDLDEQTAIFGRLCVDQKQIKMIIKSFEPSYRGIAFDACSTLRDFAFTKMHLETIKTNFILGNSIAKRLNLQLGQLIVGQQKIVNHDKKCIEIILMEMNRSRWEFIKEREND